MIDLNKMFAFDVKYDNIDDGGIGGTRITNSGNDDPKAKSHKLQIQQIGKHMSFESLKKQSSLGSLTSKLVKEVEKMNGGDKGGDERLWKPEMDKSGNGYAVIRFLPA